MTDYLTQWLAENAADCEAAPGGCSHPAWTDERAWRDLAVQRAAIEGIPAPSEVDAILGRHGITIDAIEAQIDAEQAGIAAGTLVPLSSARRAYKTVPDPK